MRALVQRVSRAQVDVDGECVAQIGCGLLVLLGVRVDDTDADALYMADKLAGLRVFEDENGRMNRALTDVDGALLVVSQFTLYGDCRKGRRPSFTAAAAPDLGEALYLRVVELLRAQGLPVQTGRFGAHMQVTLVNDGPVTLMIESRTHAP